MSNRDPYKFSNTYRNSPRVRFYEVKLKVDKGQLSTFERLSSEWRVRFMELYGWTLISATYAETGRVNEVTQLWKIPYWSVNNELMIDHAIGEWSKDYGMLDYTVEETVQNYQIGMPYDPHVIAHHASLYVGLTGMDPSMPDNHSSPHRVIPLERLEDPDIENRYRAVEIPIATLEDNRAWLGLGPRDKYQSNRQAYEIMAKMMAKCTLWQFFSLEHPKQWSYHLERSEQNKESRQLLINLSLFSTTSPFQLIDPYRTAIRYDTEDDRIAAAERIEHGKRGMPILTLSTLFSRLRDPVMNKALDGICIAIPDSLEIFWLDDKELLARKKGYIDDPDTRSSFVYYVRRDCWENEIIYDDLREILRNNPKRDGDPPLISATIGKSLGAFGVGSFCWGVNLQAMVAGNHSCEAPVEAAKAASKRAEEALAAASGLVAEAAVVKKEGGDATIRDQAASRAAKLAREAADEAADAVSEAAGSAIAMAREAESATQVAAAAAQLVVRVAEVMEAATAIMAPEPAARPGNPPSPPAPRDPGNAEDPGKKS